MSHGYPNSWLGILDVGGELTVVRVLYSDESGLGATDPKSIAVVAAVMINVDNQWHDFEADFADLPRANSSREIKGRQLFKDLRKKRGPDDPDQLLRALVKIPVVNSFPVFWGAVSKHDGNTKNRFPDDPHISPEDASYWFAFFDCFTQVQRYVRTLVPKEKIAWVADDAGALRNDGERIHVLMRELDEWKQNIPEALALESLTAKDLRRIDRESGPRGANRYNFPIIDTIYFASSAYSRALQLADVCCSVLRLHLLDDPIAEPYYDILKRSLVNDPDPFFHP